MSGPSTPARPAVPAHTPMALPRSRGGNTLVMIDSVAGMMNAPPMPMNARVAISCSGDVGERRRERAEAEQHEPDLQRAAPAEAVAQAAGGEQQAGEHQRVRVDHPLQLAVRRVEVAHDRGDRDVEDRVVEHDHEQAEAEDGEDPPPALVGAGLDALALSVLVMRRSERNARRSNGTGACRYYRRLSGGFRRPRARRVDRSPSTRSTSGQAHVGRGDAALRVEHALEHRRVRLGEAGLHDRQQRLGVGAAVVDLAREPALDHRDEALGAEVRARRRSRRRRP